MIELCECQEERVAIMTADGIDETIAVEAAKLAEKCEGCPNAET